MSDRNSLFSATLAASLGELGVRHACITPGSRNTPLSLAFADAGPIHDWSHHDERSSAFFALGIAKTSGAPAAVVTTSGTAAAELFPAVVEARHGRVPLIVITADRPFELRDVGAPQTVDQQQIYGEQVKWSHDLEVPHPGELSVERIAALAARLVAQATASPPGPVHLNVRFRDPLVPDGPVTVPTPMVPVLTVGRMEATDAQIQELAARVAGRRGVIIAGPDDAPELPGAAAAAAASLGWPILADPLSGLRAGNHDRSRVLAASDPLAWAGWLDQAAPEVAIRVGAIPTCKAIWQWLESNRSIPQMLIEPAGWRDPTASASHVVRAAPAPTLTALAKVVSPAPADWWARWEKADRAARAAVVGAIGELDFPTEPGIAHALGEALPDESVLWAASSMPIRDLDAFIGTTDRRIRILANRGANGIDGFISSGLGSAAVAGVPTVLLAGDLSVLHDLSGIAAAGRLAIPVTIVAVNNDGGGIFHFLPQAGHRHFERHFGTPHGLDLAAVASALGVEGRRVDTVDQLAAAVGRRPDGPLLVEVVTDRHENVAVHRAIQGAVSAALVSV